MLTALKIELDNGHCLAENIICLAKVNTMPVIMIVGLSCIDINVFLVNMWQFKKIDLITFLICKLNNELNGQIFINIYYSLSLTLLVVTHNSSVKRNFFRGG